MQAARNQPAEHSNKQRTDKRKRTHGTNEAGPVDGVGASSEWWVRVHEAQHNRDQHGHRERAYERVPRLGAQKRADRLGRLVLCSPRAIGRANAQATANEMRSGRAETRVRSHPEALL